MMKKGTARGIIYYLVAVTAVLALVLGMAVPALAADTTWTQFQHDAANTGYTTGVGPAANGIRWQIGGLVTTGLVIGPGNMLYAGMGDTLVALYDREDTVILSWSYKANGIIRGTPAVDSAGNIIFGTEAGWIFKLNPQGEAQWGMNSSTRISAPIVTDSATNIYFANDAGLTAKINASGAQVWALNMGAGVKASPALDASGNLYVGDLAGIVHCIGASGTELWNYQTPLTDGGLLGGGTSHPIMAAPLISGKVIYVANDAGMICALKNEPSTEFIFTKPYTVVWQNPYTDADGQPIRGMAADPAGNIYFTTAAGHLRSLNTSGSARWTTSLSQAYSSVPAIDSSGTLYVPSKGIETFSCATGAKGWVYDTGATPIASCAIGNKALYFGVEAGTGSGLYAIGVKKQAQDTPPPPPGFNYHRYFAEGYTGSGFVTYLVVSNPTSATARVQIVFFTQSGDGLEKMGTLKPGEQITYELNKEVGTDKEVSVSVASDQPVLVQRPIYCAYQSSIAGGTDTTGATDPSRHWYFAEGTTRPGFDEYLTVQNPQTSSASLTFDIQIQGEGLQTFRATVNPNSRATFMPRSWVGDGKDISVHITSSVPIVAERPMYFTYQGLAARNWRGASDVLGVTSPATSWLFAEGTTRDGFEEYLCVQNPDTSRTLNLTVHYMPGEGQGDPFDKTYTVPPSQRATIDVTAEAGAGRDISIKAQGNIPFVAERPMYFNYLGIIDGGHDVMGTVNPSTSWGFSFGYTGQVLDPSSENYQHYDQYLCMLNPGSQDATVNVTFYVKGDTWTSVTHQYKVKAGTRFTKKLNDAIGDNQEFFFTVDSNVPVVSECATYFATGFRGVLNDGMDVLGQAGP